MLARLRAVLGSLGTVVPVVVTAAGASERALVDPAGVVARRHGIGYDGIAAIRPDGHLGYLMTGADDEGLAAYPTGLLHTEGQPA